MKKKDQSALLHELEKKLALELRKHKGQIPRITEPKERPPRQVMVCRLSCKKRDITASVVIVEVEVETLSELETRIAAAKAAKELGFQPKECIEIALYQTTK